MPTYVYECSKCNKTFEIQQRIVEDPITTCHCGSEGSVKRVIQPVGIAFKGSGFYVTDSKSASPTVTAAKDAETSTSPGPAETKPTETTSPEVPTTTTATDQ